MIVSPPLATARENKDARPILLPSLPWLRPEQTKMQDGYFALCWLRLKKTNYLFPIVSLATAGFRLDAVGVYGRGTKSVNGGDGLLANPRIAPGVALGPRE